MAVREVGEWLVGAFGATVLKADQLRPWASKHFRDGWRLDDVDTLFGPITLDVLVDHRFPRSRPRVAWVHPPPFPSLPHVEEDGLFCVLSSSDVVDPLNPVGLTKRVLGHVAEVVEEGLAGRNKGDFQSEFLSYWNPGALGPRFLSILDPSGGSRSIAVWRSRNGVLLAESSSSVRDWLNSAYGKKAIASSRIKRGFLLWLPAPLMPGDYPKNVDQLRALASAVGDAEAARIDAFIAQGARETILALGAPSGAGAVFAGLVLRGDARDGFCPGFRPGTAPPSLMLLRRRHHPIIRSRVDRADTWWVHGRDSNADLSELTASSVGIIGCGSLGSPVARLLAAAGVGTLTLIDPEALTLANTSRHVLGSGSAGRLKAPALQERLAQDFPHLSFNAAAERWQPIARDQPEVFDRCNLLISTIGGWNDERELNDWHVSGHFAGTILYGWSEPYGVGGHAVLAGPGAGCLACGMRDDGNPFLTVAAFERPTLVRETACGNFFQPYGAAEIERVAAMIAELAIDLLMSRAKPGVHRVLAASRQRLDDLEGRLTADFIRLSGGRVAGGNQEEIVWQPRTSCLACGGRGL